MKTIIIILSLITSIYAEPPKLLKKECVDLPPNIIVGGGIKIYTFCEDGYIFKMFYLNGEINIKQLFQSHGMAQSPVTCWEYKNVKKWR